jgi:hypothetical protein
MAEAKKKGSFSQFNITLANNHWEGIYVQNGSSMHKLEPNEEKLFRMIGPELVITFMNSTATVFIRNRKGELKIENDTTNLIYKIDARKDTYSVGQPQAVQPIRIPVTQGPTIVRTNLPTGARPAVGGPSTSMSTPTITTTTNGPIRIPATTAPATTPQPGVTTTTAVPNAQFEQYRNAAGVVIGQRNLNDGSIDFFF